MLSLTSEFEYLSFTERLRMFMFDKIYVAHCKTCDTEIREWKKDGWKTFCSKKCAQNDPDVKARMLSGQANTDWKGVVAKREATMIEKYGYTAHSQTTQAKIEFAERTKLAWVDPKSKSKRIKRRIETNIEKYGVEHTSQRSEQRIIAGQSISKTKSQRTAEQKEITADLYRKAVCNDVAYAAITSVDTMRDLHVTQQLSIWQISYRLGVHVDAVVNALNRFNIPIDHTLTRSLASAKETELFNFVKSISPDAVQGKRFNRKQMDIYVPSKNLVIEFNGVYWHSELKVKNYYHRLKHDFFVANGFRYVQIWENDFDHKRDVVEKFITNLLNKNKRVGARHTTLKELTQNEFDQFMNDNHMQGSVLCKYRIGLVIDNQVVSAIGFKDIPSNVKRIAAGKGVELIRFANTNITGAFTKLLYYFEKTYPVDYITSFGNLEIVDQHSNVYLKNGFIEAYRIGPDYSYYNYRTHRREHKFGWRKDAFKKLGYDVSQTEHTLALKHKLLRCYDSGKIQYLKIVNEAGQMR